MAPSTSMASNKIPRTFPCQISGCVRAKNGSTEKMNIRWFSSKEAMVQHMNREHEIGIQFVRECSSKFNPDGKLTNKTLVCQKAKTCRIKANIKPNPYLPPRSPQATKNLPYLPPLTPTSPASKKFNSLYLDAPSKEKNTLTRKVHTPCSLLSLKDFSAKSHSALTRSTNIPYQEPKKNSKCSTLPASTTERMNHLRFSYICAFCNTQSSEKEQMRVHIWDVHFELQESSKDPKMIGCLHCPHRAKTLQDLSWHVEVYHLLSGTTCPEKGYCLYCLKCHNRFDSLKMFKLHTDEFQCKKEETKSQFQEVLQNVGSENDCHDLDKENVDAKHQLSLNHIHKNKDESKVDYQFNKDLKYNIAAKNQREKSPFKSFDKSCVITKLGRNHTKTNIPRFFNCRKKDFYLKIRNDLFEEPQSSLKPDQKLNHKRTFWQQYC